MVARPLIGSAKRSPQRRERRRLPPRLHNLSFDLADLYAATGERALLDEALGMQRRAVALTPAHDDPARRGAKSHLSISLATR